MTGTMRTKSGRYAARIRDPVKKKHIWLGTFDTSEEAANAYLSKQCEFKARKGIQPVICNESDIMICTRNCAEKPNEIMTGTLRTKSGRYGARIRDPFKKKHVWLGTFDTPEEAANAYLSKQREFKARKGAQPVICNDITTHRRDWGEKSTEIYTGVMRWKLRSYRDLVKKKHAWLGTFDTSKNAGNAYLSEKRDFEARKGVQPSVCTESEHRNMTDRRHGSEKPNEIMTGTLRTKSGRYGARIRDPFKKKHVWLGTFDTPEEAANAYLSKQHEFKARKGAQPVICNESDITTHRRDWGEKSTEICTGVMRRKPRSYRDVVKKKHAWLGTFDTSKKAGNAYLSEQHYFEARKGIQPTVCMEPKCRNMTDRRNGSEKPNEIMTGTLRTKSGRYAARIRDPFKKKHVWLGTFDTSEEAANAFLSKKREFETRKGVQPIGCNEFESRNRTYRRDGGEKSTEVLTEVLRKRRYGARITEPMKRKHIWLGSFDAAEEAVDAHLSKTSDFKDREGLQSTACKETELDPSNESPSSLPETQTWTSPDHMDTESETCNFNATEVVKLESVEMNGSYVLGLFEPVAGCPKFKAGSDFFLPILDNNGFLLGEFSKLDDLSICHNEDDNVPTKFSV